MPAGGFGRTEIYRNLTPYFVDKDPKKFYWPFKSGHIIPAGNSTYIVSIIDIGENLIGEKVLLRVSPPITLKEVAPYYGIFTWFALWPFYAFLLTCYGCILIFMSVRKKSTKNVPIINVRLQKQMKEEELNNLERDAQTLPDPKDREELMNAIAELREAQSNFDLERKAVVPTERNKPKFRDYSFTKFVKIIFGAIIFLVLCLSLLVLVLPLVHHFNGDTSINIIKLFSTVFPVVIASAMILYFLVRKSHKEREALKLNSIAQQFAKQKLIFQLSTIGLIVFTVFVIVVTAPVIKEYSASGYVVAFGFFLGYWLLGRKFWRCPSCGYRLSFLNKHRDRGSIKYCSNCNATLQ